MNLKDVMEGKPVRTPLHPILVHVPIALFPLASILDVLSRLSSHAEWPLAKAAFACLLGGIVSALVAAVFGMVDYTDIRDDHPAKKTATAHLILNLIAVGLYAGSAGLRYGNLNQAETGTLPLVIALAGLVVLGYSGYLGGVLVYDDGVSVGRHRHRARLPQKTLVVRTDGKPALVVEATALGEGETLRVDVDGTIATLARCDGKVHAFQEFCTHRFGPLSEGRIENCEVTCPWHRSRFDIRTGKVTSGPAKVDLKVFRAEERDGKIWIHPPG